MQYAFSNNQIRAAEEKTMAGGTAQTELMRRAGEALAARVQAAMQRLGLNDCLFVCGGGNNGGDGFVAAQILLERGADVAVLSFAQQFSAACAWAKDNYRGELLCRMPRRFYPLIVDCVFGTGLNRAPEGDGAALIEFINNSGAHIIACDLPSGLSEGGIANTPCVLANETVTFGGLKHALVLADGADVAGEITAVDIGLQPEGGAEVWEDSDCAVLFSKRKSHTHKGDFGQAAILGGWQSGGAGLLAAAACLKSGCGYTRHFVPQEQYSYFFGRQPAAILRPMEGIEEALSSSAVAIGMGTGVSGELYQMICKLLSSYKGALVIDADGLNTLAKYGANALKNKGCDVILTPHPKEFSRLTGKSVEEILRDPVGMATAFAREYAVTVVLKNNRTVITNGGRTAINITGSPALAKGGSGDVLSGFLAGTCARGVPPFEAACVASYVLGRAGEKAAADMGEYAPDATDIIGYLPEAIQSIRK